MKGSGFVSNYFFPTFSLQVKNRPMFNAIVSMWAKFCLRMRPPLSLIPIPKDSQTGCNPWIFMLRTHVSALCAWIHPTKDGAPSQRSTAKMEAAPSLLEFLGGALSTFTMSRFPWGCGVNCHACWAIVMKCYGDPILCFHDTWFFKCMIFVVLVAAQLDTFAGSRVIVPAHQKAGIKPVSWVGLGW